MSLVDSQKQFIAALQGDTTLDTFIGDPEIIKKRMLIYRNSITGNRIAAYSRLFKCCHKIVGHEFWQMLIEDFIAITPSNSLDITESGKQLPEFIAQYPHARDLPYLADLARLELAWHHCFHAAAGPSNRQELQSNYPLLDLWQLCQEPHDQEIILDEQTTEYHFILYREHDSIRIEQLKMTQEK